MQSPEVLCGANGGSARTTSGALCCVNRLLVYWRPPLRPPPLCSSTGYSGIPPPSRHLLSRPPLSEIRRRFTGTRFEVSGERQLCASRRRRGPAVLVEAPESRSKEEEIQGRCKNHVTQRVGPPLLWSGNWGTLSHLGARGWTRMPLAKPPFGRMEEPKTASRGIFMDL